jgi:glutathione S-transferase
MGQGDASMLELYHSALSPCAQKVRLCLAEKKREWRGHLLNLAEKDNLRPEYLQPEGRRTDPGR